MGATLKQKWQFASKIVAQFWSCYHLAKMHNVDLGFDKAEFEKILDCPDYFLIPDVSASVKASEEEKKSIFHGFWSAFSYATPNQRIYLGFDFTAFRAMLARHDGSPAPVEPPNSIHLIGMPCTCLQRQSGSVRCLSGSGNHTTRTCGGALFEFGPGCCR